MRWLLVLSLIGCGRLGFDDVPATPDAGSVVLPDLCNPRAAGTVPLAGDVPTKLRAAALSTGHVVAISTAANNVHVVRLDATGAIVSTHLPFGGGGYQLQGISQIGDRPFVYVFTSGGGWIKMLQPDWNDYDSGPSGEERTMDPQQALAPDGTNAVFGIVTGGVLGIQSIDVDGIRSGTVAYTPATNTASFAAAPSTVRVVTESAGTCETVAIGAGGSVGAPHTFSPCFGPLLATLDDDTGAVLHQTADDGPLAIHAIPAGTTATLEIGTNPRIARIGGAIWAGYLRGNEGARLVRVDGDGVTMRDFASITRAFDLLPSGAFWIDAAGELSAGDPCP